MRASYTRLNGVSAARRKRLKPARRDDVADPRLARLRPEREADLLGQRRRRAQQRREPVERPPHRVQVVLDAVARVRLDDHPRPIRRERRANVPGCADRVAHVVQAVEHRDEVVALAAVPGGGRDLEADPVAHSGLLGARPSRLDRPLVVVRADELRVRVCLRHQDRRGAVAAADVGDECAALELVDDALERWQPLRHQVGVVAGAEEPLAAFVDVVDVLVPAEAVAAARALDDRRRVDHRPDRSLEQTGQIRRAARVGECDRLLGRQRVAATVRVVLHEPARRLGVQPFAHVTLGGSGALGELGRRQRSSTGQPAVQAELVAHHHERRVQRRADLVDGAEYELHQLVAVDLDGLLDSAHRSLLGSFRAPYGGGCGVRFRGPPSHTT